MSGLITYQAATHAKAWGAASATGARSFAAARIARIVLRREPLANEALQWTAQYCRQPTAAQGRAELALALLARPELASLDEEARLLRAYNAVFDRYDSAIPDDLDFCRAMSARGIALETMVRRELLPLHEAGYHAVACAAPAAAGKALCAVLDGDGQPLIFTTGVNRRLYLFRRTPFGPWSQTALSDMLPLPVDARVAAVDVRQAPHGGIAVALAMEHPDGSTTIHVALDVPKSLDEAGWVEVFRQMAPRHTVATGPVNALTFGLIQQGATPVVLVSGDGAHFFDTSGQGPLLPLQLPEDPPKSQGFAIGSYRTPGCWLLRDTPAGQALHFRSFAAQYCWSLDIPYENVPKQASSICLVPGQVPNVADVYVAGQGIVVYRGGSSVPQPVIDVRGVTLRSAAANAHCEYVAYNDDADGLWLVARPSGRSWGVPVQIAAQLVMAALLPAGDEAAVHAIGITPGGALAALRFNLQGDLLGAEEITQSAVWGEHAEPPMATPAVVSVSASVAA
jgi:hypothetical protein